MFVGQKLWLVFALLTLGCGEKPGPTLALNFSSQAPLQDPNAFDLVLIVTNVPANGFILDSNQDGKPDQFVYPSSCNQAITPTCGISLATAADVVVGNLPLNFTYSMEVRVRNQAGQMIYQGTNSFVNDGVSAQIDITLSPVTP